MNLFFCTLTVVILLIMYVIQIRINRKVYYPSMIFLLYWLINLTLGLLVFSTDYQWNSFSYIYILIVSIIFMTFECIITSKITARRKSNNDDSVCLKVREKEKSIQYILILVVVSVIAFLSISINANNIDVSTLFDIDGIIASSHIYTNIRYGSVETNNSIFQQLCLSFSYFGFIFSGFVFPFFYENKSKTKWMCFFPFIGAIPVVLLTNGKTMLVMGTVLWGSSFIVGNFFCHIKIKFGILIKSSIFFVIFVCVIYMSFYIRYGGNELYAISDKIIIYAIGHVPGFDDWISKYPYTWFGEFLGARSFASITEIFNITATAEDSKMLFVSTKYGDSNVHTLFSDLIMDYGIIGSWIFFAYLGLLSGVLIKKLYSSNIKTITIVGLSCLNFFVLYSFLISPYKYTTYLLAVIIFGGVIRYLLFEKVKDEKN